MYQQPSYVYPLPYQQPTMTNIPSARPPMRMLPGIVVNSSNEIPVDAIPMDGTIAVFPKQDLSEIYIKQWRSDGTIQTKVFKLVSNDSNSQSMDIESRINALYEKVDRLEQNVANGFGSKNRSRNSGKEIN